MRLKSENECQNNNYWSGYLLRRDLRFWFAPFWHSAQNVRCLDIVPGAPCNLLQHPAVDSSVNVMTPTLNPNTRGQSVYAIKSWETLIFVNSFKYNMPEYIMVRLYLSFGILSEQTKLLRAVYTVPENCERYEGKWSSIA